METLDRRIMESRHAFILEDDEKSRGLYLKELAKKYPFKLDSEDPVAIYLPIKDLGDGVDINHHPNMNNLASIRRRYLECSVAYQMLSNLLEQLSTEELKTVNEILTCEFNRLFIAKEYSVGDIREYKDILKEHQKIYTLEYERQMDINCSKFLPDLPIGILLLETFVKKIAGALNLDSYVCVFLDKQSAYSLYFMKLINYYISARSNGNLSFKVGCKPGEWMTMQDINGSLIQNPHDFTSIDIDSYKRSRCIK